MHEGLGERKGAVLRAVVVEHIRTAEPVGSGAIARRYRLRVSPATIRNDMAALEDLGYLAQPHTSAGRIPTDSGYRYYVDSLPDHAALREAQRRAIALFFGEPAPDVQETLRGTTQLLSRITHQTAVALAPSLRESRVARVDLILFGSACLVLVITDTGRVEKRALDPGLGVTAPTVNAVARTLAESLDGPTLDEAAGQVRDLAASARPEERAVLLEVAGAFESMGRAVEGEHVIVGGAANIVGEDGFDRRETIEQVFRALEREDELLRLLQAAADRGDVTVTIGRENPVTGMWETSVIVAPYRVGDRILGTVGVVGPIRMDYRSNITAVWAVARRLSEVMAPLAG